MGLVKTRQEDVINVVYKCRNEDTIKSRKGY